MKYVRYEADGKVCYGIIEGNVIRQISTAPYKRYRATGRTHRLSRVKLLAPVVPGKIVGIAPNYKSRLGNREAPKVPEAFYKTATSVTGPEAPVVIPRIALEEKESIQPEAEMAVVIGKRCRGVKKADALKYVLGYTCGNDISARNWQRNDRQWWRAKSSDTFCPLGPVIATDVDPSKLQLIGRINGKVVQEESTSGLLYDVPTIIEFISSAITLEPGDVIMTGTPGTNPDPDIHPGDTVEVELVGIGVLRNPVEAE